MEQPTTFPDVGAPSAGDTQPKMVVTTETSATWRKMVLPVAVCACMGYMVLYVFLGWYGWGLPAISEQAPGEVSRWCERVSDGIFREPANAVSNLGFVFAGLLMLRVLSTDSPDGGGPNQFHGLTPVAMLYAIAVIWLGPGSMLMHGTHTAWGAWADNLSMVMYILIPWLVNVAAMGRWTIRRFFLVYLGLVIAYGVGRLLFGGRLGINLDFFGLSIALWGISEVLYRFWSPRLRWLSGMLGFVIAAIFGTMPWDMFAEPAKYWWVILFWLPAALAPQAPRGRRSYKPWFVAGVVTYMTAFAIWLTGRPGNPLCNPDSLIQAHAIWHLLSALATWCFFKFLRTECVIEPTRL